MESGASGALPDNGDARFVVGGRTLTMEQFLDALTRAVLETVRSYDSGKAGKPSCRPDTVGRSDDNLRPTGPDRFENAG
jgi:hypothetical protein